MSQTYSRGEASGRSIDNLKRMAYFVEVVETGSFTAAADRLGITKAVVSQQVARLEAAFETTLLVRTTRSVRLTDEGQAFYDRAARLLGEAQDAFDGLEADDRAPSGVLRLTAPFDYAVAMVVPALAEFQRRFPACRSHLSISDRTLDPSDKDIELAIRVGWLADSALRARRIGAFQQILVGRADIAGELGPNATPEALADLPFVANSVLRDPLTWTFSNAAGERRAVKLSALVSIDATLGVLEGVRSGIGVSVLPDFAVHEDLESGRLVRLLPAWRLDEGGIYAVTPAARFKSARVKAFIEILTTAERTRIA
ncbi:HTH-type transcriptional regulator DmlR [compost metagenome]